jgi:hypothetical protein
MDIFRAMETEGRALRLWGSDRTEVFHVKQKSNGRSYAMKVLHKVRPWFISWDFFGDN